MLNRMTHHPPALPFSARRKTPSQSTATTGAPQTPTPAEIVPTTKLPLYYIIKGGGDGTYTPCFFSTQEARDQARQWANEHDYENVFEADGKVTPANIYTTFEDYLKDWG